MDFTLPWPLSVIPKSSFQMSALSNKVMPAGKTVASTCFFTPARNLRHILGLSFPLTPHTWSVSLNWKFYFLGLPSFTHFPTPTATVLMRASLVSPEILWMHILAHHPRFSLTQPLTVLHPESSLPFHLSTFMLRYKPLWAGTEFLISVS